MACNINIDVKKIKCDIRLEHTNKELMHQAMSISKFHKDRINMLSIKPISFYGQKYQL